MKYLLVTSSINIIANDSIFIESKERAVQTYNAINKILNLFDYVYLVDGSNYNFSDIEDYISAHQIQKVRVHSFVQNENLVRKKGKAFGELLIYQEFIEVFGSDFRNECNLYKISGRWFMNNMYTVLRKTEFYDSCYFQYYPNTIRYKKYIQTCFFKTTVGELKQITTFGLQYFSSHIRNVNLEDIFSFYLDRKEKHYFNVAYPDYTGVISGSSGKIVKMNSYYFMENILSSFFKQYAFSTVN